MSSVVNTVWLVSEMYCSFLHALSFSMLYIYDCSLSSVVGFLCTVDGSFSYIENFFSWVFLLPWFHLCASHFLRSIYLVLYHPSYMYMAVQIPLSPAFFSNVVFLSLVTWQICVPHLIPGHAIIYPYYLNNVGLLFSLKFLWVNEWIFEGWEFASSAGCHAWMPLLAVMPIVLDFIIPCQLATTIVLYIIQKNFIVVQVRHELWVVLHDKHLSCVDT